MFIETEMVMMNEPESKSNLAGKAPQVSYSSSGSTIIGARSIAEGPSGFSRAHKSTRPVPFSGLLTNKLLTALPGEDFARLLPHLEPVSLSTGEDLYGSRGNIHHVYFPETVVISHLYFMEDGSMTSAAIIGREGVVGLSRIYGAHSPSSYLTQVTIGGNALRVETEVIRDEFARGGAMQSLLLNYTSARLAQLSQRAVCNGRHKLDERLCTWVLMIHDRAGEENLPLTHEEIAHHLGARRAGITASCNALRQSGAINYRRGIMRVLDRQRLVEAACECYQALGPIVENPWRRRP
jgi:CRP-like cAMP-binding protein